MDKPNMLLSVRHICLKCFREMNYVGSVYTDEFVLANFKCPQCEQILSIVELPVAKVNEK